MNFDKKNANKYIKEEEDFPNFESALKSLDHYVVSYPYLVQVSKFQCKQWNKNKENASFKKNAIFSIAHMAYGWIPSILKKCDIDVKVCNVDTVTILKAHEIDSCKKAAKFVRKFKESPINTKDAWVGLSKVLHFINPKFFPIWDTNVASNFFSPDDEDKENLEKFKKYKKRLSYWVHKKDSYICYIKWCHTVLDKEPVFDKEKTIQKMKSKLNCIYKDLHEDLDPDFEVSKIRALEFMLFLKGKEILADHEPKVGIGKIAAKYIQTAKKECEAKDICEIFLCRKNAKGVPYVACAILNKLSKQGEKCKMIKLLEKKCCKSEEKFSDKDESCVKKYLSRNR
ncbi:MAG: hypothetical protein OXF73_04400 [Gammaproteobacteria bacterium]|nr:hypothetical protein [Gammaproteobacteria bacterium]